MKKLYKIFENSILGSDLINEALNSPLDYVRHAIENRYYVNIVYGDEPQKRYCQIYNLGKTKDKKNITHDAIRVFQVAGPNKRTFKTFRLDRIKKWEPVRMRLNKSVSEKNPKTGKMMTLVTGDKTLSGGTVTQVSFKDGKDGTPIDKGTAKSGTNITSSLSNIIGSDVNTTEINNYYYKNIFNSQFTDDTLLEISSTVISLLLNNVLNNSGINMNNRFVKFADMISNQINNNGDDVNDRLIKTFGDNPTIKGIYDKLKILLKLKSI
jgi:hypothetical protein